MYVTYGEGLFFFFKKAVVTFCYIMKMYSFYLSKLLNLANILLLFCVGVFCHLFHYVFVKEFEFLVKMQRVKGAVFLKN